MKVALFLCLFLLCTLWCCTSANYLIEAVWVNHNCTGGTVYAVQALPLTQSNCVANQVTTCNNYDVLTGRALSHGYICSAVPANESSLFTNLAVQIGYGNDVNCTTPTYLVVYGDQGCSGNVCGVDSCSLNGNGQSYAVNSGCTSFNDGQPPSWRFNCASTSAPTSSPTSTPTSAPTNAPTNSPTNTPTNTPTNSPTSPTSSPTSTPTSAPTKPPTNPTIVPPPSTPTPTNSPTSTSTPSNSPTSTPTLSSTPPTPPESSDTETSSASTPSSVGFVALIIVGLYSFLI